MSKAFGRAIVKEYNQYKEGQEQVALNIYIQLDKNNLTQWQALIFGPDETEWEGGVFHLSIELKETYPSEAPKIKFIHPKRMFHPNVYQNGEICLDILQKGWTPAYNLLSALKSIQSLLTDPNTSSPANAEAAILYDKDREEYLRRVQECVISSWQAPLPMAIMLKATTSELQQQV